MKIWIIVAIALLAVSVSYALPMSCHVQNIAVEPCNSPNISVFSMIDTSNSHAGEAGTPGYDYAVCCSNLMNPVLNSGTSVVWLASSSNAHVSNYSNATAFPGEVDVKLDSDAPLNCSVKAGSCDAGWATLGSMMDYYNSHVGDENQAYDYKICCVKDCDANSEQCIAGSCCGGQYCATKNNYGVVQPASDWHCCAPGEWWDPAGGPFGIGGCAQAAECASELATTATEGEGYCIINILNNSIDWFADQDCRQPAAPTYNYGCCNVSYFNTYSYGWNIPSVYGRTLIQS